MLAYRDSTTSKLSTGLQTYIIKLSRSGEDGEKAHLVLESGTRFHTTQARALARYCWPYFPLCTPKALS